MTKFGIWLSPPEKVLIEYNKLIFELSKKYSTQNFETHITILSTFEGKEKDVLEKVKNCIKKWPRIPIKLMGVNIANTFHQCIFAQVQMSAELLSAHNSLKENLSYPENYKYFPHMSLVYGDFLPNKRFQIAQKIKLPKQSFLADKLIIVKEEGPKPQDWKHILELKL